MLSCPDVEGIASPIIDAAIRSASATKLHQCLVLVSDVGDEPDAGNAETPGDTYIDVLPFTADSTLVGMVELMPHFLESNNHCLFFLQLLKDIKCS